MKDTAEPYFEITIFERHSEVAGICTITSPTDAFATPMYEGLETNVPLTLVEFKDFPYLTNVGLFFTYDQVNISSSYPF